MPPITADYAPTVRPYRFAVEPFDGEVWRTIPAYTLALHHPTVGETFKYWASNRQLYIIARDEASLDGKKVIVLMSSIMTFDLEAESRVTYQKGHLDYAVSNIEELGAQASNLTIEVGDCAVADSEGIQYCFVKIGVSRVMLFGRDHEPEILQMQRLSNTYHRCKITFRLTPLAVNDAVTNPPSQAERT